MSSALTCRHANATRPPCTPPALLHYRPCLTDGKTEAGTQASRARLLPFGGLHQLSASQGSSLGVSILGLDGSPGS